MKKYLVGLAPIAAVAAMAIAPGSALASPGQWGGWAGSPHQDNVLSTTYWTQDFGHNGAGNSQYCVGAPNGAANDCSIAASPVVVTGVLVPTGAGCNGHQVNGGNPGSLPGVPSGGSDPCADGNTVGAFYVGVAPGQPAAGTGVGLQG